MLSTPSLNELPEEFKAFFGRSNDLILTGHFYTVTIDPANVVTHTTAEQTFTVTGLKTSDLVLVNKPTLTAGLAVGACRVSADNTLAITYINASGVDVNADSEDYLIVAIRREKE